MTEVAAKNSLKPNEAGALAYLLVFITGLYFFLTSKDKFVRFHGLQSTITSIGILVFNMFLNSLGLSGLVNLVVLVEIVVFIFLFAQAYRGKKFKLPFIGDLAEKNV